MYEFPYIVWIAERGADIPAVYGQGSAWSWLMYILMISWSRRLLQRSIWDTLKYYLKDYKNMGHHQPDQVHVRPEHDQSEVEFFGYRRRNRCPREYRRSENMECQGRQRHVEFLQEIPAESCLRHSTTSCMVSSRGRRRYHGPHRFSVWGHRRRVWLKRPCWQAHLKIDVELVVCQRARPQRRSDVATTRQQLARSL